MRGLDVIGAGQGLAAFTIMLHIKSIDTAKLRAAVAGDKTWGATLPGAIQMADSMPEMALEVALPIAKTQLEKIGVTADLSTTQKAPKSAAPHEMLVVLGVGGVLGFVLSLVGQSLYHLVVKPATPAR